jgi:hypothetical protein
MVSLQLGFLLSKSALKRRRSDAHFLRPRESRRAEGISPYTINVVFASEKWRILAVIADLDSKIVRNDRDVLNLRATDPRASRLRKIMRFE